MSERATLSGVLPNDLANAVSDAIHAALERGMEIDEAACVVAQVAADYARGEYGAAFLDQIAMVVLRRGTTPLPVDDGEK